MLKYNVAFSFYSVESLITTQLKVKALAHRMASVWLLFLFVIQFSVKNLIAPYRRRNISGPSILATLTELRYSNFSSCNCFKEEVNLSSEKFTVYSPKPLKYGTSEQRNTKEIP